MKNEGKVQAVERMKARARPLPPGYTFDRDQANTRRTDIAAVRAGATDKPDECPSAARSQDFLYDEDGLPG